jgi:DUF3047 family protein
VSRLPHAARQHPRVAVVALALAALAAGAGAVRVGMRSRAIEAGREMTPGPVAAAVTRRPGDAGEPGTAPSEVPVALSERPPGRLPAEGVPAGWELREFAGRAAIELVRNDGRLALRLRSDAASFAVYRDAVIDMNEYPRLAWSWKVVQLPPRGDVRDRARDDQAAQLYVVFPRWPSPLTTSDVVGYVWDSHAPVGTQVPSTRAPNVRLIVVESGSARLGQWQSYARDLAQDYQALFGRVPPRTGKVALMIDSNDTRSQAESFVADLRFARASP